MTCVAFLLRDPIENKYYPVETLKEATEKAIRRGMSLEHHPAFELIEVKTGEILGTLWRDFGKSFDPENCWRNPKISE